MNVEDLNPIFEKIEEKLAAADERAEGQMKEVGKLSTELKSEIEAFGVKQREMAEQLLDIQQKGVGESGGEATVEGWGQQLVKSDRFEAFARGDTNKCRVEVKNTITGGDSTVAPDRASAIVPGAFAPLTLEAFLPSVPTSSNAIEFTKEASFTNNAAEAAEAAEKAESAVTFSLVNMPVSTVAHWLKISRQLASDNAALAAYVEQRLRYGVNRRVETQLVAGNGTAPNISGILDSGNYTAHGYLSGALGSTLPKLVLVRKIMGDLWAAGYMPDGIIMNPSDWATIETELLTTNAGQTKLSYSDGGTPRLWGVPVIQSVGMTADNVAVGAFAQAYTIHNREGVIVDMSDSDDDNFTKNLITIRAERRLALATEVPAACRAGDITPPAT